MTTEEKVWWRPSAGAWLKSSKIIDWLTGTASSAWGVTAICVIVTLFVYYFTAFHYEGSSVPLVDAFLDGPSQAPHNHPVRLADAFLHGRLDVANGKDLLGFLDFACQPYPCAEGSKYYPLEPPGTALVILPGVALFGLNINQTLVSIVIGAITAGVVYQVSRRLTENIWHQLFLTAMFIFGTVYWWNSVYGGVWYFNHAVAALFLFAAVYETLASKRPFTAGIFLGAAYITRLPTVWTAPFFLIMFADFSKLRESVSALRDSVAGGWTELRGWLARVFRISLPVLKFGIGLSIFVVGFAILNLIRFDTASPEATYDHWHAKASLEVPGGMIVRGFG